MVQPTGYHFWQGRSYRAISANRSGWRPAPNGDRASRSRTMEFKETSLPGVWLVEPVPFKDERGAFARLFCRKEFAAHGLENDFVQHSQSHSVQRGTLRGMHFQAAPHEEVKLVRCLAGAMWDVVVDNRPDSPTYLRWED